MPDLPERRATAIGMVNEPGAAVALPLILLLTGLEPPTPRWRYTNFQRRLFVVFIGRYCLMVFEYFATALDPVTRAGRFSLPRSSSQLLGFCLGDGCVRQPLGEAAEALLGCLREHRPS